MLNGNTDIDEVRTIFAGKYRRYHGMSLVAHFFDIKTWVLNIRDIFLMSLGLVQSIFLVGRLKPDVAFLKGGFVGVPVGLAAALWHVPFVTHDSDAMPGLANRLVSRWARYHATGMPATYYNYPEASVVHVGVIVGQMYEPVTPELQRLYRQELRLPEKAHVLLVTGGSLGARRLNQAAAAAIPMLLTEVPDLHVIHQVGKGNGGLYGDFQSDRLHTIEFMHGMHRYSGAADVVITRAGANTLAELGVQGKACIVVPNPLLTGGHQLKNAELLKEKGAVMVIDEAVLVEQPETLKQNIEQLFKDKLLRDTLGKKLRDTTMDDAAERIATLVLELGKDN